MTETTGANKASFDQPRNINDVGSHKGSVPIKKVLFVGVFLFLVVAGLIFGIGWFINQMKTKSAAKDAEKQVSIDPSAAPKKMEFGLRAGGIKDSQEVTNPVAPTGAVPASVNSSNAATRSNPNASVPAILPRNTGTQVGVQGGVYGSEPARPVNRYAGDISLDAPNTQGGALAGMPNLGGINTSLPRLPSGFNMPPTSPVSSADAIKAVIERLQSGGAPQSPISGLSGLTNAGNAAQTAGAQNAQGAVGPLLRSTSTPRALAVKSIDENLVIPKGRLIDCTLTTRIVTEVSGFASCIVSSAVYSANGRTLLIERFSEVEGEYVASAQAGQRSIYVIWSRVRKPGGVTIDIDSPATDGLGTAGLPGYLDNRWFERIGNAYMLSFFKDLMALEIAKASAGSGGSTAGTIVGAGVLSNTISTSNSLAEKVLQAGINIKPTIYKNQGDRASIYVSRDLDFSPVYETRKP